MISIVTGTLNRRDHLWRLFHNTVYADKRLELVLVDGGSTDTTIEHIKAVNHPRVKLIEVGKRSNYGHYMNIGIKNASHEWICQWNDDCVLVTPSWNAIIDRLPHTEASIILFSWTEGDPDTMAFDGWRTHESSTECVMNYGLYHKDVFRKVGLYDEEFKYYCADGEMSKRASLKFKHETWLSVRVASTNKGDKRAIFYQSDLDKYANELRKLNKGILKKRKLLK